MYQSTVSGQNCVLPSRYAPNNGNYLPKFRDILYVPSSFLNLKMGPTGCPEISVRNYHYSVRNNPEERNIYQIHGGSFK